MASTKPDITKDKNAIEILEKVASIIDKSNVFSIALLKIAIKDKRINIGENYKLEISPACSSKAAQLELHVSTGKIAAYGGEIFRENDEFYYKAKKGDTHNIRALIVGKDNSLWAGETVVDVKSD